MKTTFFSLINLVSCVIVFAQTTTCKNRLDTTQVIEIAMIHNAYWTSEWYAPPAIKFDKQNCEWTIVSYKSKHTDRGDCKNTNGCTLFKKVTLVIDAETKKVISKHKTKTIRPNYE